MISVGPFQDSDRDAVRAFVAAMFDDEQDPQQRPAAEFAADHADAMFRAVLERGGIILVARKDVEPIGFGCIAPNDNLDPTLIDEVRARASVDYLFVARAWRRKGVGRKLLHALEGEMRRRGRTRIRIRHKASNLAARKLYAAAGYLPQEFILSRSI